MIVLYSRSESFGASKVLPDFFPFDKETLAGKVFSLRNSEIAMMIDMTGARGAFTWGYSSGSYEGHAGWR